MQNKQKPTNKKTSEQKTTKATIFHAQKLQLEVVLMTSLTIPLTSDTRESLDIVFINNLVSFGMKLLCVLEPLNLLKI